MGPLEPDKKVDMKTYNGGQLPGITVEAVDLSKAQKFPYGGFNVISKSINGGLDRKRRAFVNPFDSSFLAESKSIIKNNAGSPYFGNFEYIAEQ
jgi:hypothetical protein